MHVHRYVPRAYHHTQTHAHATKYIFTHPYKIMHMTTKSHAYEYAHTHPCMQAQTNKHLNTNFNTHGRA